MTSAGLEPIDSPRNPPGRRALAKVPEITAVFWALKLLTTGMGEAMSDFLGQHSVPLAAVFGTMAADGIRDGAGLSYSVTTPAFAIVTAAIFGLWYRSERTLSIHSIDNRRREVFYWAAVLATFALGTAAGDLTGIQLNLGFWPSVVLFGAIICLPAIGWWQLNMNPIAAFWFAYVVTRPLGASFADGFSKTTNGGLGLGDGPVAGVAFIVFAALVAWVTIARIDVQPPAVLSTHPHPHEHHPHLPGHPHPTVGPSAQLEPEAE